MVTTSIYSETTISAFNEYYIKYFGTPSAVLADRDSTFTSHAFKDFIIDDLSTRLYFPSTGYSQGNGLNESAHRILEVTVKIKRVSILLSIRKFPKLREH